jgi:hypothetical protein
MLRTSFQVASRLMPILTMLVLSSGGSVLAEDIVGTDSSRYKGTVHSTQDEPGRAKPGVETAVPPQEIFLRVNIESGKHSQKNDIDTYYTKESKLSAEEYGRLTQSPLVSKRVALWKAWYSRVFDEIKPKGEISADVQMKLNVSIDKKGKVLVSPEWRNAAKNAAGDAYADTLVQNIRNLEGKPWLAFPENSWLELVKFDVYVNYDSSIQLVNDIQRVDYD